MGNYFWVKNSGLESRFLFFGIAVLLDDGQKPAHFLSEKMAMVSTFFKMFICIVPGMHNFGSHVTSLPLRHFSGLMSLLPSNGCQDIVQAVQIISSITQLQYEQS